MKKFKSTEEIEEYVSNIKMKQSIFGRVRHLEVYNRLKEIHEIYMEYIDQLESEKEHQILKQRAEIYLLKRKLRERQKLDKLG